MRDVVLALASLARAGQGCRVRRAMVKLQRRSHAKRSWPQRTVGTVSILQTLGDVDLPVGQITARSELNPLQLLATLLLAVNPEASLCLHSPGSWPAVNSPAISTWKEAQTRLFHNVLKMGQRDELVTSEDGLRSLTVKDLRAKLKSRGLKVSGNKADLIARLQEQSADSATEVEEEASANAMEATSARPKVNTKSVEAGRVVASTTKPRKVKPVGPYTHFKEKGCIPEPEITRRDIPIEGNILKAVVWNINGLRAFMKKRRSALQDLARLERPSVIGLIEHKLQEEGADSLAAMKDLLDALPEYESAALHCSTIKKGYSGALLLVHKDGPKPLNVEPLDLSSAKAEGRLIIAEFQDLFVVLAYVPNSGDKLKRLQERTEQWDPQLREKLQELSSKKAVLLLGDLNVAHRDVDIWNVEASHVAKSAGTTPEERSSFSKLLDVGFVDGFAEMHPEALGAFTYWSVRARNRPKNRGLRLDYAVVSKSTLQDDSKVTLLDVFHLPEMSEGDHCPVGATFLL